MSLKAREGFNLYTIIILKIHIEIPKIKFKIEYVKANMNSYIQLQTAAIFFLSSLYLKQGIDSVYVMVGFICKG